MGCEGTSPQLLRRAQAGSRSRLARRAAEKGFAGLRDVLKVQAVGQGRGSFILEMGGVKVLVNPNLEGSQLKPEAVHEEFDYVFLSSEEPEFFHRDTVSRMKLTKVKFVASAKAGQELTKMMVRNLAVLQNGPGGQCSLAACNVESTFLWQQVTGFQVHIPFLWKVSSPNLLVV